MKTRNWMGLAGGAGLACGLLAGAGRAQDVVQPRPLARISGGVMAGQILTMVPPVYPSEAKDKHVSGIIVMHAVIGKDGTIRQLEVISGPEMLRDAALMAVQQWTYKPYLLNGKPTEVDTTVTVNFSLGGAPGGGELPPLARVSGGVMAGQIVSKVPPV